LKLDGYRALAFKTRGRVELRSRNNKDFASRYPSIADALQKISDETILDGEIVAFDESGRPSFNKLQNYGSSTAPIYYYAFDLLMLAGRDLRSEPLEKRRELLRLKVLSKFNDPVRYSPTLDTPLNELIQSSTTTKIQGLIANAGTARMSQASVRARG
jgi:bifunctional non-homologous end joining protein LigD